jgi:RHS repeat-associated protein
MPGIGYQGDYTDATTGLVHMGARWYDPSTGAFTSNDTLNGTPLPSTADGNPYAYANGNPLTETDPTGHGGGGGTAVVDAPPYSVDWSSIEIEHVTEWDWLSADGVPIIPTGWDSYSYIPRSTFQSMASNVANVWAQYESGYDADSNLVGPPNLGVGPSGGGAPPNLGVPPGASGGHGLCTTITCPPILPPPPPPPPQNPYAAGLVFPTNPPGSLTNNPWITKILQGLSSIASLFGEGHGIHEKVTKPNEAPDGTKPDDRTHVNSGNQDEPATSSGGDMQGGGSGGGTETGTGECIPEPENGAGGPTYKDLVSQGARDSHHIIQNAAVRDLPDYSRDLAPAIQLAGPSTTPGTPHYAATQAQRLPGGGTYGEERQIAYDALRAAGFSDAEAQAAVERADQYFMGSLCIGLDTPTRIPGNRRTP